MPLEHPNTIILKNRYYPQGLTELDIYTYYRSIKNKLLKEVYGREVFFYIVTDSGLVVKRKYKNSYIYLTSANFDKFMTGRTLSVHSTFNLYDNILIVDIDTDDISKAKILTRICYDEILESFPISMSAEIRYTGKNSFHIFMEFREKMKIDALRLILVNFLQSNNKISKNCTIGLQKPLKNVPNIETRRNSYRNGFITLHSLSKIGLKCMKVPLDHLKSFDPMEARIK